MPAQPGDVIYSERTGIPGSITVQDILDSGKVVLIQSIAKNTNLPIAANKEIIYVSVFNPSTGRLLSPQVTLAPDRLSGNIKINQDITNAEITIITR